MKTAHVRVWGSWVVVDDNTGEHVITMKLSAKNGLVRLEKKAHKMGYILKNMVNNPNGGRLVVS